MASAAIRPFAQFLLQYGEPFKPENRATGAAALSEMMLKNQTTQQALKLGEARATKLEAETKKAQELLNTKLNLLSQFERQKQKFLQSGYTGPVPTVSEEMSVAQIADAFDNLNTGAAAYEQVKSLTKRGQPGKPAVPSVVSPIEDPMEGFGDRPAPSPAIPEVPRVPGGPLRELLGEGVDMFLPRAEVDPVKTLEDLQSAAVAKAKEKNPADRLMDVSLVTLPNGSVVRQTRGGVVVPSDVVGAQATLDYVRGVEDKRGRAVIDSGIGGDGEGFADIWTPSEKAAAAEWDDYYSSITPAPLPVPQGDGPPPLPALASPKPRPKVPQPTGYRPPEGAPLEGTITNPFATTPQDDKAADDLDDAKAQREKDQRAVDDLIATVKAVDKTDGNSLTVGIKSIEKLRREPYKSLLTKAQASALDTYYNGFARERRVLQKAKGEKNAGKTKGEKVPTAETKNKILDMEGELKKIESQLSGAMKVVQGKRGLVVGEKFIPESDLKAKANSIRQKIKNIKADYPSFYGIKAPAKKEPATKPADPEAILFNNGKGAF